MGGRCLLTLLLLTGCDGSTGSDSDAAPPRDAPTRDAGGTDAASTPDAPALDAPPPILDAGPTGPIVDRTDPQLHTFDFTAADADPGATMALGTQLAFLDTRVEPLGRLVVYLHGAGAPTTCGSRAHGEVLAAMGYHVLMPCYVSDYGVGNCDEDIEGYRLEAFEGVDHHDFIAITPPDSAETRIVRALEHLASLHAGGDWSFFADGATPRWSAIVISGISHGASSSGVIGIHRSVARVVMLSGPLDTGQAWLARPPMTPIDRFYGFTHTADDQHDGHLAAFETMALPGTPTSVEDTAPSYGGSHRLITSAATTDGHGSTQAGGSSPRDGSDWVFQPVWDYLYAAPAR